MGVAYADFEQLEAQLLKLGEQTVERCLVRQMPGEHGRARFCVHVQAGKGTNQHLAQESADTDLVARGLRRVFHGGSLSQGGPTRITRIM